jgi:small subunit ribosomal protein S1
MNQDFAPEGQEATKENEQQQEEETIQEESQEIQSSMEDLLEDESLGFDFPRQGDIRKGTVARVTETEILVSIGTKSEGVIPSREMDQVDPELREELAIGNEVTVYVVNPEDQNGNVLLSFVRALEEKDWVLAESLLNSGETYDGNIIGFNKGGLIIPVGQLRGFVPASQISILRRLDTSGNTPEQRWGPMVDQPITVSVIEVDRERRRLILSERAALQETRESLKERLLEELSEGDIRTGRVTSLADFGAFVNIDGADGLVHLSEISWERIEHPREVLKVGQEVQVKVIGVDRERKRIGLSIRQLQEDPWVKKIENLKEGQLVEGTITHLTKFGAFARLDEELEGLIHISEISEQRVAHPKEVLHEGEVVTLRVIKIEPERHRIGLSLRKVDSPAYTDFDWKMTLAEVVEETSGEDEEAAPEDELSEDETPQEVVESVEEGDSEAESAAEEAVAEVEAEGEQALEASADVEPSEDIPDAEELSAEVDAAEVAEGESQEEEQALEAVADVEPSEDVPDAEELSAEVDTDEVMEEESQEEEQELEAIADVEPSEDVPDAVEMFAEEDADEVVKEETQEEVQEIEVIADVESSEDGPVAEGEVEVSLGVDVPEDEQDVEASLESTPPQDEPNEEELPQEEEPEIEEISESNQED